MMGNYTCIFDDKNKCQPELIVNTLEFDAGKGRYRKCGECSTYQFLTRADRSNIVIYETKENIAWAKIIKRIFDETNKKKEQLEQLSAEIQNGPISIDKLREKIEHKII